MLSVQMPKDLLDHVGADLGSTATTSVPQSMINQFAEATGDHQWIHVDVERATAQSPFGGPIAHGYLTLSLTNLFLPQLLEVKEFSMGVNVGLNKVRFPSPVPAGAQIFATGELVSAEEVGEGIQSIVRIAISVTGSDKPSCIADTVSRYFA